MGEFLVDETNVDPRDYKQSVVVSTTATSDKRPNLYYRKRACWTTNKAPAFTM